MRFLIFAIFISLIPIESAQLIAKGSDPFGDMASSGKKKKKKNKKKNKKGKKGKKGKGKKKKGGSTLNSGMFPDE